MDKSKIIKMLKNFKSRIFLFCHSRAGGNPELANNTLDSRLRGNDRGNASTRKSSAFQKPSAKSYQLKSILPIFRNLQPSPRHLPPTTYHLQPKKGFAMLFSVLISSLLVAIGLSIFSLTLKELTISTSARESQVAFYAANSGMDCAVYWNFQGKFDESGGAVSGVTCGASSVIDDGLSNDSTGFKFYITNDLEGPCVDVVVDKSKNVGGDLELDTVIESRGKNICGTGGRKVERGLTATIITPPPVI